MTLTAERSFKRKDKKQEQPKIKYENLARLPHDKALVAHQRAIERGARCTECPLFGLRAGPVMGDIVRNSRLAIIGEAPGLNEVEQGRPFVGKSGDILNEALLDAGVFREDCTITNAMLCRPPEELKAFEYRLKLMYETACERAEAAGLTEGHPDFPRPPVMPAEACSARLKRDIEESNSKVVSAVGGAALRAVANHWDVPFGSKKNLKADELRISSLKKQLGAPITMPDGTIVVASYHPAFAMRAGSRHYMHVIRKHLTRAAQIAKRGHIDWREPKYVLNPTVEQVETVLERMRTTVDEYGDPVPVTIDIETDKGSRSDGEFDPFSCRIRCIGFGAVINGEEVIIVVPIRSRTGAEWWINADGTVDLEAKRRVVQACMDTLNYNPLVGHNLSFDTSVLLRFKMLVRRDREYDDTMLLHHDTPDNDLPHDLGFVAARYYEVPSWKGGADDKYFENPTDEDLHLYNARDVLTTMRLYPLLREEVYRYGTNPQYELDRAMAPIARDMGELGLFVDEVKRGELSLEMNKQAHARLLRLKEIVGDANFNPNSPPQVRKYLFNTKKLIPVINSKGKDWEEGEDPSTNTQALMRMQLQQGCDDETKDFINNLFEFRAYMKLKGTYIDKLRVSYVDWSQYGFDIPMVPAVLAPVYRKYKKGERAEVAERMWPEEWTAAAALGPVKGERLSKENRRQKTEARKQAIERLIARVDTGIWEEQEVIPARPALSRLHTTYKLHVIPSGRLSTAPAVQNWPERGKANMREMIVSPPGHIIVGADLDQIELRLYAVISGDKLLLEAFEKGLDPHSYNAASLFAKKMGKTIWDAYLWIVGLPRLRGTETLQKFCPDQGLRVPDEGELEHLTKLLDDDQKVDAVAATTGLALNLVKAFAEGYGKGAKEKKKLRGYAKTFAYLETYGGEADKLYQFMSTARDKATGALMFPGLKEEDVQEWHTEWHRTHPETKAWQELCQRVARREGYTAAPIGSYRKRFFPGGPNKPGAVFNHVIQAAAAEVMNAAMLKIAKLIPYQCWSPFTGLMLQVHDYLGVYCPKEYAEEARRIIEECMQTVIFSIAITCAAKASECWAQQ